MTFVASVGRPGGLPCLRYGSRPNLCKKQARAQLTTLHKMIIHYISAFATMIKRLQRQKNHGTFFSTKDEAATASLSAPKLLFCFHVTKTRHAQANNLLWGRCPQTPAQRRSGNGEPISPKLLFQNICAESIKANH